MMIRWGKPVLMAVLLLAGVPVVGGSGPALKSSVTSVQLRATVQERLSLVAQTPLVGFGLQAHRVARADRPISFITSWNLDPTRTAVVVSAFYQDAGGAQTAMGSDRTAEPTPSAEVWGRGSGGTFVPFSAMAGWPGAGMEVFRQQVRPRVNDMASRTDDLELQIDLTRKKMLASGSYEGVLTLVAEAY
jgi:hypothetical protein